MLERHKIHIYIHKIHIYLFLTFRGYISPLIEPDGDPEGGAK